MKKFIIILLLMVIIPLKVQASVTITNANIQGPAEAKIGEKIIVKYSLDITGLDKTKEDSDGVYGVILSLALNEKTFTPTAIKSDMDSYVIKYKDENDLRFILSEVTSTTQNKCRNNTLFCGSKYEVEVEYQINDTTEKQAQIILASALMVTYPVNADDMTEENQKDVSYGILKEYTINIIDTDTSGEPAEDITMLYDDLIRDSDEDHMEIKDPPPQVTTKPTTQTTTTKPQTTTTTTTEEKQSRNTKIKTLEIKDAEYKFDNTKNYLEVFVKQDINSLDINIELEDPKSTYEIIGADDLRKNDNRVKIEVSSENGQKRTYTLNVKIKDWTAEDKEKVEMVDIFGQNIEKKYVELGTYILGSIIILAILIGIIKFSKDRISNKKYYKALKELENDNEQER